MKGDGRSEPRSSYLGAALQTRENRLAAAVVAAVVVLVLAASRVPVGDRISVDLTRVPSLRSTVHATPIGFLWPRADGAELRADGTDAGDAATARVVFNRPLPARFRLELFGRCTSGCDEAGIAVRVGASSAKMALGTHETRRTVEIDDAGGSRSVALTASTGASFAIREIRVRPWEQPS